MKNAYRRAQGAVRARRLRHAGAILLAVLLLGSLATERYLATSDSSPEAYPILPLDHYHRLLVIAPHCDDEVLGAGGLIQAALGQGLDVRVVIVTACDSYRRAAMAEFRRPLLKPADFVTMGERRQQESLDALRLLGLNEDDVMFLAYPEQGLAALWWDCWESDRPYRSPYSKQERNVYHRAFRPDAPYSGETLLEDLRTALEETRPDLIVTPHPDDENPDHRTLNAFVLAAVEMEQAEDPQFQPDLLGYLVHYGLFPQPFGLRPLEELRPPRQMEALGGWVQWRLSAQEVAVKQYALQAYRSQQRVSGYFLNSFIRRNELFMQIDPSLPVSLVGAGTFADVDIAPASPDQRVLPGRQDPVKDSVVRRLIGRADIQSLYAFRWGDTLWMALDVGGRVSRAYTYDLLVRAFGVKGTVVWRGRYGRKSLGEAWPMGHMVWYRLDLEALGNPEWLMVAAETRQGVVIDRTAWYLMHVTDGLLDGLAD